MQWTPSQRSYAIKEHCAAIYPARSFLNRVARLVSNGQFFRPNQPGNDTSELANGKSPSSSESQACARSNSTSTCGYRRSTESLGLKALRARCLATGRSSTQGKSRMNLHPTAALTLVGWFVLMVPPIKCKNEPVVLLTGYCRVPSDCSVDSDQPIANWTPLETFVNVAACRDEQEQMPCRKLVEAKCVSVNDPRIQGVFLGGFEQIAPEH
jgi:hypothetical protein